MGNRQRTLEHIIMIKEKFKFCNSTALVYNYSLCDSKCEECGEWQEGEEIK